MYVFTKDVKQLTADLDAIGDKEAVIQRYRNADIAKGEVRCESLLGLCPAVLTCLNVCARDESDGRNRKSGEGNRTRGGPEQQD